MTPPTTDTSREASRSILTAEKFAELCLGADRVQIHRKNALDCYDTHNFPAACVDGCLRALIAERDALRKEVDASQDAATRATVASILAALGVK